MSNNQTVSLEGQNQAIQPWYSGLLGIAPMLVIFLIFYVFVIRPQDKKKRQHEEIIKSVQVGEEILTHAGFFGKVVKVEENTVEVEISKGVIIKILKSSIASILSRAIPK